MAITALLPFMAPIMGIIDKIIPNPNEALKIKAELMKQSINADSELYKAAGGVITAEAQGESWMQRNWRPITMLTFVFIIANNYIIVPYVQFMADMLGYMIVVPVLEIPSGMWGLLQIGIGGYIASRGLEKVVTQQQQGGVPLIGSSNKNTLTRADLDADREKLLAEMRSAG